MDAAIGAFYRSVKGEIIAELINKYKPKISLKLGLV
jgi:hypothetical protein